MVKQRPISFKNHRGLTLRGVVHEPKEYDVAVVCLHGFPGDMSGSMAFLCKALSRAGYLAMRFDFGGSGTSAGKFEDKLMSDEVKDTRAAIDFLAERYAFKKLVLIGISTGAIDAALYAHRDKRVSGLVLAAVVSDLAETAHYDFNARQVRDFWKKGYITYNRPGHWVHRKKLKKAFYDEFFSLNLQKAVKKYHRPVLIIHGECDEAIPVQEAHRLFRIVNAPRKLVVVPGAGHTFRPTRSRMRFFTEISHFIRSLR